MGTTSGAMTDEAQAIRREMAHTRAEMSDTLEQLQVKLDPKVLKAKARDAALELGDRAKDAAYEATIGKVGHMVENAGNAIKDTSTSFVGNVKANPIPLAIAAVGLGWFVYGAMKPKNGLPSSNRYVRAIGDKTDQIKDQASHVVDQVKDQATHLAGDAQHTIKDVAMQAQRSGRDLEHVVERTFLDNPLAIGLGMVAVGLAVGLAIPITHKEEAILGKARDTVLDKVQQVAQQAIGKVEERAKELTTDLKNQGNGQTEAQGQTNQPQPFLPATDYRNG